MAEDGKAEDAAGDSELRARTLAHPARRRVWDAIRRAGAPTSVAHLSEACDLHPNTIRLHLQRLVGAGLVAEEVEAVRHAGRPGYRYRVVASDPVADAAAYRRLAGLLAQAVRSRMGPREAGRAAGAAQWSHLAGTDPLDAILTALGEEGFEPVVAGTDGEHRDVVLRACPFADAAAGDPFTICQMHLGLAEGAARVIGGIQVEGLRIVDPHRTGCTFRVRVPAERSTGR